MIRKRTRARECVLQVLYQLEINPAPLDQLLKDFWVADEQADVTEEARKFAETVVQGTAAVRETIDEIINRYADNWKIQRMAAIDRNILRFAAYEILYMAEIPPKVTINEAVNLAKKFSQEESGKFVNGILDKINHTEPPKNPKFHAVSDT